MHTSEQVFRSDDGPNKICIHLVSSPRLSICVDSKWGIRKVRLKHHGRDGRKRPAKGMTGRDDRK